MRKAFDVFKAHTLFIALIVLAVVGGASALWWYGGGQTAMMAAAGTTASYKTPDETDRYVRFDMEGYDLMREYYWQKAGDSDYAALFQAAVAKAAGTSTVALPSNDRTGVAKMLTSAFRDLGDDKKKQLASDILTVALYNLPPAGRNQLLSQKAQQDLSNEVNNVDPNANLYGDLGLPKNASTSAVQQAYEQKATELAATTTESGKAELAKVEQAHEVLSKPLNKAIYDTTGGQPTVTKAAIGSHTLYIGIGQVAPTTINEFAVAIASSSKSLDRMILDLRGNIGGALDFTQYLLALFLGPNQYAFDLYHQGDLEVQRTAPITKAPELARFKEIAVLTDGITQSTAELTAEQLRHDRLAYVIGETSRGWGTVEHVYPLTTEIDPSEQFAILIVQYMTLRDDGTPIEGNGVTPDVNIKDADWKSKLSNYFNSPDLINAIKSAVANPPKR